MPGIEELRQRQAAASAAANTNLAEVQGISPDQAVLALRNQQAGGPPASVGMYAPAPPPIVPPHPAVARFAQDPARAAAVQDDHHPLGVVAQIIEDFKKPVAEGYAEFTAADERAKRLQRGEGLSSEDQKSWWGRNTKFGSGKNSLMANVAAVDALYQGTIGSAYNIVRGVGNVLARPLSNLPGITLTLEQARAFAPGISYTPPANAGEAEALRASRQSELSSGLTNLGINLSMLHGGVKAPLPEAPLSMEPEAQRLLSGPPNGFHPTPGHAAATDAVFTDIAEMDAKGLETLEKAVSETKTLVRSPEVMAQFVDQVAPEGSVRINPSAILAVMAEYPEVLQDHHEEIVAAAMAGRDVEIPLSTYLSEVSGKPFADQLRESVRVREGGVSPAEAKELPKVEAAALSEPSVPAGMVREYATGKGPDTVYGSFTPDRALIEKTLSEDPYKTGIDTLIYRDVPQELVYPAGPGTEAVKVYQSFPTAVLTGPSETLSAVPQEQFSGLDVSRRTFLKGAVAAAASGKNLGKITANLVKLQPSVASIAQKLHFPPEIEAAFQLLFNETPAGAVWGGWGEDFRTHGPLALINKAGFIEEHGQALAEKLPQELFDSPENRKAFGISEHEQQAHLDDLEESIYSELNFPDGTDLWKSLANLAARAEAQGKPLREFLLDQVKGFVKAQELVKKAEKVEGEVEAAPANPAVVHDDTSGADTTDLEFADEDFTLEDNPELLEGLDTTEVAEITEAAPAIESAVKRALKNNYLNPLFTDAKAIGMTEGQFSKYAKKVEEAVKASYERMFKRFIAQLKKERTPEWKEAFAQRLAEVQKAIEETSAVRAAFYLRYNQHPNGAPLETPAIKVNLDTAKAAYGEGFTSRFPKEVFSGKGLSPDEVGDILGFSSGKEMLDAVAQVFEAAGSKDLKSYMKEQARVVATLAARAETGFDLSPEGLASAASEAIAIPQVEDLLIDELRELAKEAQLPFDKVVVKSKAQQLFSNLTVKSALNIREFERTVAKNGRAAEMGLLKGKFVDAFQAKEHQVLNQLMLAEAHAFTKWYRGADKKLKRWGSAKAIGKTPADYLDRIHAAMAMMGLKVPRFEDELDRAIGGVSMSTWVETKADEGRDIHTAFVPSKAPLTQRVEEFRDVMGMLNSIATNGALVNKVRIGEKEIDRDELIDQMTLSAGDRGNVKLPVGVGGTKTLPEKVGAFQRGIDAYLKTINRMIALLDGEKFEGPWYQAFMAEAVVAADKVHQLQKQFYDPLSKSFGEIIPKETLKGYDTVLPDSPLLDPRTGFQTPLRVLRGDIMPIVANMGTESGLERLAEGYGTTPEALLEFVSRHITEPEMRWMQQTWDMISDELFPLVEANKRKLTGVGLHKEQALALDLPFGSYKGGYWPVVYDQSLRTKMPEYAEKEEEKLLSKPFRRVTTPTGFEKARTKGLGALYLSLDGVLKKHLDDVFIRLAYGEYIPSANGLLENNTVRHLVSTKLGPEYLTNMESWLKFLVFDGSVPRPEQAWMERTILKPIRNNYGVSVIGASISVAANQAFGVFPILAEYGLPNTVVGALKFYSLVMTGKADEQVFGRSKELQRRMFQVDQQLFNLHEEMRSITSAQFGVAKFRQQWGDASMAFVGLADRYLASGITWVTAYDHYMATGEGTPQEVEEKARRYADNQIVVTQGSGSHKDLSGVRRETGELHKWMTMFGSWPEAYYNIQTKIFGYAVAGKWRKFIRASWYMYVIAALAPPILLGDVPDDAKDDPEAFGLWALRRIIFNPMSAVPGLRDVANGLERKLNHQSTTANETPMNRAADTLWNTYHRGLDSPRVIQDASMTLGLFGIIPGGASQIGKIGQTGYDYLTGSPPDNPVAAIVKGPK